MLRRRAYLSLIPGGAASVLATAGARADRRSGAAPAVSADRSGLVALGAKVIPDDDPGDSFGESVALAGDTALVNRPPTTTPRRCSTPSSTATRESPGTGPPRRSISTVTGT